MTTDTIDFDAARKAMIDSQLRTSGVNEAFVIAQMGTVKREDFVPAASRPVAYIDRALPLENGRRMAAPLFYGMALAEAQPHMGDDVLVVDAGSGYMAELVRALVNSVDTISPDDAVAKSRKTRKYSLILVDGAIEQVPASLAARLSEDGRIVTGIAKDGVTRLATGRKSGKDVALLPLAELGIPRLTEFDTKKAWSF